MARACVRLREDADEAYILLVGLSGNKTAW
jgi:hypothetical protein